MSLQTNDRVICFDPLLWNQNGGDCRCGCLNDCFCKPATVVCVYQHTDGRLAADLNFDHRGESKAHFLWAIRKTSEGK